MPLRLSGVPNGQYAVEDTTINPFAGTAVTDDGLVSAVIEVVDPAHTIDGPGLVAVSGSRGAETYDIAAQSAASLTATLGKITYDVPSVASLTDPANFQGEPAFFITVTDAAGATASAGTGVTLLPAPLPAQSPPPATFSIYDLNTNTASTATGTPYGASPSGATSDLVEISNDSLIIGSPTPNVFIYAGPGIDNIWLGNNTGANVMEEVGGGLMTGGAGNNTFMVDDNPSPYGQNTFWTTAANFHGGDNLVMWGITAADFGLTWSDGGGGSGLTLKAFSTSTPDAYVTIQGYSEADLGTRLWISFGGQGTSSPYLLIQGHG